MKITRVYPGNKTITVDTENRKLIVSTPLHPHVEAFATILEDVTFMNADMTKVQDTLAELMKMYGNGIVYNTYRTGQVPNRIAVYDTTRFPIFDDEPHYDRTYKVYYSDQTIVDEFSEPFQSEYWEKQETCAAVKQSESERVKEALGCGLMEAQSGMTSVMPTMTLGALQNALSAYVAGGYSGDTPVYIDDGSFVRPMSRDCHAYKSGCGDRKAILLIADEKTDPEPCHK